MSMGLKGLNSDIRCLSKISKLDPCKAPAVQRFWSEPTSRNGGSYQQRIMTAVQLSEGYIRQIGAPAVKLLCKTITNGVMS